MQVIAEWSLLETHLSGVFVKMLGANPAPGAAIYAGLTATATQKAALRSVAQIALTPEQDDVFEAILWLFKSAADDRNKVAHWVWGHTPDLPDRALLCKPATFLKYHVEYVAYESSARPLIEYLLDPPPVPHPEPGVGLDEIFVYSARDFTNLSERVQTLMSLAIGFRNLLAVPEGFDAQAAARLQSLSKEPAIREFVSGRRAHRKTAQEAPPQ